jgi:ribosomal protein S18 acetylase RimI-like enzyme
MSGGLGDTPLELRRDGYVLTTDRDKVPIDAALELLHTTFWAAEMPRDQLARAVRGSIPFAVLRDGKLVAFARVVSDLATFAYLCDVVVDPAHGRKGLAQWIVRTMLEHPQLQGLRRFSLITSTARPLYEKFGFREMDHSVFLELRSGGWRSGRDGS